MKKINRIFKEYGRTNYYALAGNKLLPLEEVCFIKACPNAIILEDFLYHLADDNTVTRICSCKENQVHEINDKELGCLLLVKEKLYQVTQQAITELPLREYCIGETAIMVRDRIYFGNSWYAPGMPKIIVENDSFKLIGALKDDNNNIFIKYKNKDYYDYIGEKCTVRGNLLIIPHVIGHDEAWLIGFSKLEKFGTADAIKINETGDRMVFRFDRIAIGYPKPVKYEYQTYKLTPQGVFELEGTTSSWVQKF